MLPNISNYFAQFLKFIVSVHTYIFCYPSMRSSGKTVRSADSQFQVSSAKQCMVQVMRQCRQTMHFIWNSHGNVCRCVEKIFRNDGVLRSRLTASLSNEDSVYRVICTGYSTRQSHTYTPQKFLRIIICTPFKHRSRKCIIWTRNEETCNVSEYPYRSSCMSVC